MAEPPMDSLDANFFYNSMLTKALVQIIPANERKFIDQWLDKLLDLDEEEKDREMRNEYVWFILLMLQSHKIRPPFNKSPPSELISLRELVDKTTYEEVLIANDENMKWIDPEGIEHDEVSITQAETKRSTPSKFLDNQPVPKAGVICYMAAFSDQSI